MPGASLVAAVVEPAVLACIPGESEPFFDALRLECQVECNKTDGIWLIQGMNINCANILIFFCYKRQMESSKKCRYCT